MIKRDDVYIDGEWRTSRGLSSLEVINPVTEDVIATVPDGTAEDVGAAADAAARAFDSWSRTPGPERAAVLHRIADILERRSGETTRMIIDELGQPASIAEAFQTTAAIEDLRIAADSIAEITWDEQIGSTTVHRAPAGVVGAITPWNAPLKMVTMKAGAAMAAGCTVVLKGTEIAPMSSYVFAEAAHEAGLPPGVFNLVSGTGPEVGEAIVTHPLVDMVSLTGSVRAGVRVMELAARSVKRVALELGGKSANVILGDADLERAISVGMDDSFRNSGQVCGGLSRVLVPAARLGEAQEIARAKAESFVLGDPYDPATTLGPVKSAAQRDRIRGYIRSGVEDGMRLIAGGDSAPDHLSRGYFVRPTVLSGDNSHRTAREEIFGPVSSIIPFDSEDEAVAIANDSEYGLAAAIWAADPDHARDVATRIRAGRIRINGSPINPRTPHGGFKLSGIGREFGRFGVEDFTEYQSIG